MRYIDNFLNAITMYRLVLYCLLVLAGLSILFAFTGVLPYSGLYMLLSFFVLAFAAYGFNMLLEKLWRIPANTESYAITSLILFFVLAPATTVFEFIALVLAVAVALAGKFLLAPRGKIVFNPAAFAAVVVGIPALTLPIWWIASPVMLIPTGVAGFLIARKIRRVTMVLVFVGAALLAALGRADFSVPLLPQAWDMIASGPLIFLASIMLTEPSTTPGTSRLRLFYAALVGILYGTPFSIWEFHNTPELSLLLGNLFSYATGFKTRLVLYLKEKKDLGSSLYEFVFVPNRKLQFSAGQYLEWTLGHDSPDTRGNRRYFTIASSPTEPELRIGVKIADKASSYKRALQELAPGEQVFAGQLAGNFTLPEDTSKKIVGIAGGIGITPFRSMVKQMLDRNERRDIVLFYAATDPSQFIYKDMFKDAEKLGLKTVYVLSGAKEIPAGWQGKTGFITKEMVEAEVGMASSRLYYLSGPNVMVENYSKLLRSMGVPYQHIKTDYFPGY